MDAIITAALAYVALGLVFLVAVGGPALLLARFFKKRQKPALPPNEWGYKAKH